MASGLHYLHDIDVSSSTGPLIDIVAIHDLGEVCPETWTHGRTGSNWLRDFVPQLVPSARVLSFSYEALPSSFFGPEETGHIQRIAETFVQELYADRKLRGMLARPIIFVCHGLGGIIAKKALAYSSTRLAPKVEHLRDAFVSTFAIMFFGTPHGRTAISNWTNARLAPGELQPAQISSASEEPRDIHCFHSINTEFVPHLNAFHLFFFWEEVQTSFVSRTAFVVDHSSAIIDMDNIEKAGIHASHAHMVKFESAKSTSYQPVAEALLRYCQGSERVIAHRWTQARLHTNQLRIGEAFELGVLTFDIHSDSDLHIQKNNQKTLLPVKISQEQRQSPAPKYFYPPVDAIDDFIGREKMLQTLRDKFFPNDRTFSTNRKKSFVIFGMGGSGKTQLCSKFAQEHQDRYTSIFTIHAATSKTIEDSFEKIAMIGGLHPTKIAGQHFLNQQEAPWLLIIDNADDPSLDLHNLFPQTSSAHIIVTTRNPKFRKKGSLGSLKLEGLTEPEALQLLLTRADIEEPWDVTTRRDGNVITRNLGYLAIALIHAGNCISQGVCTLGDYPNLHSSSRSNLQRRSLPAARTSRTIRFCDEDDMVGAVYSTFDLSFDYLEEKHTIRSRDATELLKISSFYHFERVPEKLFTRAIINKRNATVQSDKYSIFAWLEYFKILQPPSRLPQFLMDTEGYLDESRVTWALDELQSLSLINRDPKEGTFSMHPLVHQWARDKLTNGEKAVWASISINTLLESILLETGESVGEASDDDVEAVTLFHRSILPHLDVCLQEHGSPISASTASTSKLSMLMSLLLQPNRLQTIQAELFRAGKCARIYGGQGQFEKAALYLGEVRDTLINLRGRSNERTMQVSFYLSNLYWGMGRLEDSIELLNSVVHDRTAANGLEHEQTLIALSSLGRAYWLHGDYINSLSVLEAATAKMKVVLGSDHPLTMEALDNYGITLGSWWRFEESRKIHKQVLDFREKSLGPDHSKTLETKMNLAMALLDLGQWEEAEDFMQTVYQKRQQKLGKEHPWTLWALCYLTKVYIKRGSLQKAEELLTWGVDAGARSLNDKHHLGVLMGQGYLAMACARQGKFGKAENITLETLAGLIGSRGEAHPDTVFCQFKLARLYQMQDRTLDAIEQCEQALQRAEARITREHPMAKKIENLLKELQSTQALRIAVTKPANNTAPDGVRRRIRHSSTY